MKRLKGSLGDVTDERKDFVKKRTEEIHFSIFIENRNWDLKLNFILKQKWNVPFDPPIIRVWKV